MNEEMASDMETKYAADYTASDLIRELEAISDDWVQGHTDMFEVYDWMRDKIELQNAALARILTALYEIVRTT